MTVVQAPPPQGRRSVPPSVAGSKNNPKVIATWASPSRTVVWALKLALVLLILLLLPKLVQGKNNNNNKNTKNWNHRRLELRVLRNECWKTTCGSWIPEERMNCFLSCLSQTCYTQVYAAEPLEPGELDYERFQEFETCLRHDLKQRNQVLKQEQQQARRRQEQQERKRT